jgi:hypothetical protein
MHFISSTDRDSQPVWLQTTRSVFQASNWDLMTYWSMHASMESQTLHYTMMSLLNIEICKFQKSVNVPRIYVYNLEFWESNRNTHRKQKQIDTYIFCFSVCVSYLVLKFLGVINTYLVNNFFKRVRTLENFEKGYYGISKPEYLSA